MVLSAGTRVGPYEILEAIGAGGMGEVYRARDLTLHRDVAIKVLPQIFANDPDRLARFEREAHVLASLNHPNIAHIHGLEESNPSTGSGQAAVRALVMELVDGSTLAHRIAQGPMPSDEALPIAQQIAEGLGAAHASGVIHRDLKPANIKVRPDGSVKILDFGLAKALDQGSGDATDSPTRLRHGLGEAGTEPGMILGTAPYMAPEQARGKAVDKRADIWAFGCIVYEMLTGRRAFCGDSVSDTLAEVIKGEPDWRALPAETPAAIQRLLRRCLQKHAADRLHDIADARLEIVDAQTAGPGDGRAGRQPPRQRERLAWAAALAVVSVVVVVLAWTSGRPAPAAPEMRVDIATPPTRDTASLAISPDGRTIAFVAADAGRRRLWLRSLESGSARPLAGTDGAAFPFWAPHGRSVGFFADDGKLKRIDVNGGAVRILAGAGLPWGGTWNRDDTILFAPVSGALFRVPATGGEPTAVTTLEARQSNHSFPSFLPDGRHFVYYVSGSPDVRGVYVASLGNPQGRRLVDADSIAACAALGYLLFVRGTTLFAQPLDPERLELSGTAFPVAQAIAMQTSAASQVAAVSASPAGRIVYRTGPAAAQRQFVWFDRSGRELGKVSDPDGGTPLSPSISADDRRVALHRTVDGNVDIWLLETGRGVLSRFTSHPANDIHPIWSPDGSRILFNSNRSGSYALYEKSTVGPSDEKLLLAHQGVPTDWSRDGRVVLLHRRDRNGSTDIWALPMTPNQQPFPVVQTDFDERDAQFSPDGKWMAFESIESGRSEVVVQPFPGPGGKVPVSINGGAQVRWRRDGKELFFIGLDDRLMAVPISLPSSAGSPEAGAPVPLFATRVGGAVQPFSRQQYVVSPDGQRFLMNTLLDSDLASPITLILNWQPRPDAERLKP